MFTQESHQVANFTNCDKNCMTGHWRRWRIDEGWNTLWNYVRKDLLTWFSPSAYLFISLICITSSVPVLPTACSQGDACQQLLTPITTPAAAAAVLWTTAQTTY